MSPDKKEKLAALAREPWKCVSVKPPECYWPDCGCDPYATEVINHLDDAGWTAPRPASRLPSDQRGSEQ